MQKWIGAAYLSGEPRDLIPNKSGNSFVLLYMKCWRSYQRGSYDIVPLLFVNKKIDQLIKLKEKIKNFDGQFAYVVGEYVNDLSSLIKGCPTESAISVNSIEIWDLNNLDKTFEAFNEEPTDFYGEEDD